jgi:hypothetical protein
MNESLIGIRTGEPQAVIVTVAKQHVERMDQVVKDLKLAGLKVRDVLMGVGAINGDVMHPSDFGRIEKVAGVQKVTRSRLQRPRGDWSPRE